MIIAAERSMMMRPVRPAICALAVVILGIGVAPALAQLQVDAVLNAVSYRPIPDSRPIHVRVLDNSEAKAAVKRRFERALTARGYALTQSEDHLVLTIESSDELGFWSYESGALITADRGYSEIARKDLDSYQVSIYDTRKGGLINRPERPAGVNPTRYRLDARLEDRDSGRTLWQGWTTANLDRGDGRDLILMMVPTLADNVGTTVRSESVSLR